VSETVNTETLRPIPGVETKLSVVLHTDWQSVESVRGDWEYLLKANPEASIFLTPEWLQSWWKAYGNGSDLQCLSLCEQDSTVVAIAPLLMSREHRICGKALRTISFIGSGSGDSDDLNFVVRPGYENACIEAFFRWLGARNDWDLCALETLSENSLMAQLISSRLASLRWPHYISYVQHWHIPLPETWEQYLESLSPEFRPLLTRYPRRLESRYSCRVVRCQSTKDLAQYLPVLFDLHQRRRREIGDPGAFASAERRQFYEFMAAEFLRRGWLEFWLLEVKGAAVAAQFCFRYGRTVYLLQEGFDPNYANDRVGYVLRSKMLQTLIDEGAKTYDFLGGADAHKQRFAAKQDAYVNFIFAKPRTFGGLYLRAQQMKRRARRWMRASLPESIVSAVRASRARKSANKNGSES
jgi:CelD/BcsL family acetyltransferase involved in cellulose biosynthesis